MGNERNIQEAVRTLAGSRGDSFTIQECTVESVNMGKRSCNCRTLSGIAISDVRLMSEVEDGVLIVPKADSVVIVGYTKTIEPFICQFSSIDKVLLITGDSSIELKDGQIKFNDGSFDGLIKISDLVTKLNNIENKLNTIIAWGVTVTPPLSTNPMINTQNADIENNLVVHGK